jgi:hypothetical protein
MVAFFRQILTLLLVLLQFAAPLVHAHVDAINPIYGLHLHEFEHLHTQGESTWLQTLDAQNTNQSAIVALGQAIDIQPTTDDLSSVCYVHLVYPQAVHRFVVEIINFSPHSALAVTDPFLRQNPTRAPPSRANG